jgi:hypothetical protein
MAIANLDELLTQLEEGNVALLCGNLRSVDVLVQDATAAAPQQVTSPAAYCAPRRGERHACAAGARAPLCPARIPTSRDCARAQATYALAGLAAVLAADPSRTIADELYRRALPARILQDLPAAASAALAQVGTPPTPPVASTADDVDEPLPECPAAEAVSVLLKQGNVSRLGCRRRPRLTR